MPASRHRRDQNGWVPQPTLAMFEAEAPDHRSRIVAHAADRAAWLTARSRGVTATDAAKLASIRSVGAVANQKLRGDHFGGNAYTDHGRAREPEIARWVQARYGIEPSDALFHADAVRAHLATPDGVGASSGSVVLAEIKTTSAPWRTIPRSYLRQVWWQQYVLGAERTLFVWEQHADFVPVAAEPQCRWIDRDENQIHLLISLANRVLEAMRG